MKGARKVTEETTLGELRALFEDASILTGFELRVELQVSKDSTVGPLFWRAHAAGAGGPGQTHQRGGLRRVGRTPAEAIQALLDAYAEEHAAKEGRR